MSTKKVSVEELGFTPVALAVDPNKTYTYTPEGQDHIPQEKRCRYHLRPPSKSVVEQVQNTEIDFQVTEGSDKHTGHLRSGTTRKIFVVNCLAGWDNLYREVKENGQTKYEQVEYKEPGPVGAPGWKERQEHNYENIPDEHVTGIISVIRNKSKLPEAVEGKSETSGGGTTT